MSSTQVRLHPATKAFLDLQKERINKARAKAKKKPLSFDDVVALAIEHLTVEMGVER